MCLYFLTRRSTQEASRVPTSPQIVADPQGRKCITKKKTSDSTHSPKLCTWILRFFTEPQATGKVTIHCVRHAHVSAGKKASRPFGCAFPTRLTLRYAGSAQFLQQEKPRSIAHIRSCPHGVRRETGETASQVLQAHGQNHTRSLFPTKTLSADSLHRIQATDGPRC